MSDLMNKKATKPKESKRHLTGSIRFRLVGTYVLIILLTVVLIEIGIYALLNNYYESNIKTIIKTEQSVLIDLYEELYYNQDFYLESQTLGEKFISYTKAQLQLLDLEGRILYDGIYQYQKGEIMDFPDIKEALVSTKGSWIGEVEADESVYAHTTLVKRENEPVGMIRMVTSLEPSRRIVRQFMWVLILIGLGIVLIVSFISVILAGTIIKPVKKIAEHASHLAKGDYTKTLTKTYDDELGQLSDELNHMSKELSKTEQLKDQFIGSVSHELRTPLTSIKGWAVTLKTDEQTLSSILTEGLTIIEDEADRLTELVNELLDFSRLSSGQLSIAKDYVDLEALLRYIYRQMKPRADRLHLDFRLSVQSEVTHSEPMIGDYNRLKQVFINLLDNSFKYSDAGGQVHMNLITDCNGYKVQISDQGQGIAQEDLEHVFRRFYQGHNALDGGGLGLAIAKELVELHQGSIDIVSERGEGTKVTVTFS